MPGFFSNNVIPVPKIQKNEVEFIDPDLKQAVRISIGKPSGFLTKRDLRKLTELIYLPTHKEAMIRSLSGLEFAENLTNLRLHCSFLGRIDQIRSLSRLTDLHLWNFDTHPSSRFYPVENLSVIQGLINLKTLSLDCVNCDISEVGSLKNLEEVYFRGPVKNGLGVFSGLTQLKKLKLSEVGVNAGGLSPLALLQNLTHLYFTNANHINDLAPLALLPNLIELTLPYLARNWDVDLKPLRSLTHLEHLNLSRPPRSSISPQNEGKVTELDALSHLTGLKKIQLDDCDLNEVTFLKPLVNLKEISLTKNPIYDISPLGSIPNLEYLRLGQNAVSDFSPLLSLPNLKELDISEIEFSKHHYRQDKKVCLADLTWKNHLDFSNLTKRGVRIVIGERWLVGWPKYRKWIPILY
jgi:Leucine-rich repeat (LRR) protein